MPHRAVAHHAEDEKDGGASAAATEPAAPRPNSDAQGAPVPPLLHLRLPAALLADLSRTSQLALRRADDGARAGRGGAPGAAAADAWSLTVARGGAGRRSAARYRLEAAARAERRDCYRAAATSEHPASEFASALQHVGTTDQEYTVRPEPRSDLKEIGNRTRRRLEEQRKKRKVIVRLDDDDLPPRPAPGTTTTTTTAARKPTPEAADTAPPKRARKKAGAGPRHKKRRVAANVDGWMPAVDAPPHGDRSNTVRVHGLPHGTTPELLHKFFRGLRPARIFALPSCARHLAGWDARHAHAGGRPAVPRHARHFRVFVRFASAPIAEAALARSGEAVGLSEKQRFVGAAIALSPVPKHVASFLQKHLAVHARKGESIAGTLTNVERALGTVGPMAWKMATHKLELRRDHARGHDDDGATPHLDDLGRDDGVPTDRAQYARLAKAYNRLIDVHARLEAEAGVLFVHAFDPACAEDSVHRITHAVSTWLLDDIDRLGGVLKEARHTLPALARSS